MRDFIILIFSIIEMFMFGLSFSFKKSGIDINTKEPQQQKSGKMLEKIHYSQYR